MRSGHLVFVIFGLLAPFAAAQELGPLAVTVNAPAPSPAEIEASQRCIAAKEAAQRDRNSPEFIRCLKEFNVNDPNAPDHQTIIDLCALRIAEEKEPACKAKSDLSSERRHAYQEAYAKAVRARDDCVQADPAALAGSVNLRSRAPVTAEQMTAVRRCVEFGNRAGRDAGAR